MTKPEHTSGYAPPSPKSACALGRHPFLLPYFGVFDTGAAGSTGASSYSTEGV
jgi:hypothetical protein